jgi:hypothetical protein
MQPKTYYCSNCGNLIGVETENGFLCGDNIFYQITGACGCGKGFSYDIQEEISFTQE